MKNRPSSLFRADLCPGSTSAEEGKPHVDSPDSIRGKKLHDAMALVWMAGEKNWDKAWTKISLNEAISEEEMSILKDCHEMVKTQQPDDPDTIILVEKKLNLDFLGLTGGTPDIFFVSPKFKTAVLIDYKFGVGPVADPAGNWQMRSYGAGIIQSAKTELVGIEPIILQPSSIHKDDRVRAHVWERPEVEGFKQGIEAINKKSLDPKAPRIAGDAQCHFCKAKDTCPEYKDLQHANDQFKAAKQEQALLTIQSGTKVEVTPDAPLVAPVVIMDEETIKLAEGKKALMMSMKVTDLDTANAVGRLSKDIRGVINLIEKNREKVKAPFLNFGRKIDAEAKKATGPLNEAANFGDVLVDTWQKQEQAKARAIQEAEDKKRQEALAQQQKALEAERLKLEEATRLAREAQEALERAQNLKTKAAREKAQAEANAATLKAEQAQVEANAQRQAQLDAERRAQEAEAARVAASQPKAKVAGYRDTVETTWEIPDFSKIPPALMNVVLLPNKKVIDQMIATKAVTEDKSPWIVIKREDTIARSR